MKDLQEEEYSLGNIHLYSLAPLEQEFFGDMMAKKKKTPTSSLVPEIDSSAFVTGNTKLAIPSLASKIKEKNKLIKTRHIEREEAALAAELTKVSNRLIFDLRRQIDVFLAAEDPAEVFCFESKFDASPFCPTIVRKGCPVDFVKARVLAELSEIGKVTLTVHDNSVYVLQVEVQ